MGKSRVNIILLYIILLFNPVLSHIISNEYEGLVFDLLGLADDLIEEETYERNKGRGDVITETLDVGNGKKVDFLTVFPKRSLLSSLEDADELSEWTPISNQIAINETQYYQFVVNTTSYGIGEYYEILVLLSGNICKLPSDLEDKHSKDNQLQVYYTYNQTKLEDLDSLSTVASFEYGYMSALASNPAADPYSNLYIAVRSPYTDDTIEGSWYYEMGISQNDLVFQWDDRSWANLVDSDDSSALFITGNLSSSDSVSTTNDSDIYNLHIYSNDYRDYFEGLNRSWCAVKNGPELIDPDTMASEMTTRYGNVKEQFYVEGLNSSTKYIAYLTQDFSGSASGGAVFLEFEFETLDEGACKLVFDLSFCEEVAYSVPAPSGFYDSANTTYYQNKTAVAALYDNYTESLYSNFAKAIQLVACDDELDSRYSPITTCDDCENSYKEWLCAVSIPRCSSRDVDGYKYRAVGDNRNDFIDDVISPPDPYYEMLPCVNMCHAIVRDCPSDFGFACPTTNKTISLSYYWDESDEAGYSTCNYFGDSSTLDDNSEASDDS